MLTDDPDFHVRQILHTRRHMERADRQMRRNGFLFLIVLAAIGILSLVFPRLHLWIGAGAALVIIYLHLHYKAHLPLSKVWSLWFGYTAGVMPPLRPGETMEETNFLIRLWVRDNIKGDYVIRRFAEKGPDLYRFWRRDDFERFAARWMDYRP